MAKSSCNERIISRVRAIAEGFVRTYRDIDPRAPRLVGRILSQTHDLPWHRVVRADGTLPQGESQRELLIAEGVPMRGKRVDLDEARLPRQSSERLEASRFRRAFGAAGQDLPTTLISIHQFSARTGQAPYRASGVEENTAALVAGSTSTWRR